MEISELADPKPQTPIPLAALGWLSLAMLVLAALAYWAPWVNHNTAALKLSGQDLGEFVKFIPAIRRGQMRFPRQLFYLPLCSCVIGLVVLSTNGQLSYPHWLRVGTLILALVLLPGLLPPAWGHPKELFTPEFRLQGIALMLGLLLILAHGAFRGLSLRALALTLGALALTALIPAQWAFWAIRPRIWLAYGTPTIRLGWGLWLDIGAWMAMLVTAALLLNRSDSESAI